LITEEEEYQRIVDNPPPVMPDTFVRHRQRIFLGSDGVKYTVTEASTHSGKPELVTLKDDLHDSFWRYPLLDKRDIDTPPGVPEAKNHSEYCAAKKR